MTTITINENLPLKKRAFESVAELLAALEEQNIFIMLHELQEEDVTDAMKKKAKKVRKAFMRNPSSFSDI